MRMPRSFSVLVILLVLGLGLQTSLAAPQAQAASALALPPIGQTAYEFVAQIDQSGVDLEINGYLTHVSGVSGDKLFAEGTDPAGLAAAAAFFTMHASGSIYARSILQSIFDTDAQLTLSIYYNDPPVANFEDMGSFATGEPVATYDLRLQNILNVQSPDVGIASSSGESTQTVSRPFTFNGQEMTFGEVGSVQRMNAFGQGFRRSQEPLVVQLLIAGNAVGAASQ